MLNAVVDLPFTEARKALTDAQMAKRTRKVDLNIVVEQRTDSLMLTCNLKIPFNYIAASASS